MSSVYPSRRRPGPQVEVVQVQGAKGADGVLDIASLAAEPAPWIVTESAWDSTTGLPTAGTMRWPDGGTGTFSATCDAFGYATYTVTHVLGSITTTYTQPTVTRDGSGRVTNRPAIEGV